MRFKARAISFAARAGRVWWALRPAGSGQRDGKRSERLLAQGRIAITDDATVFRHYMPWSRTLERPWLKVLSDLGLGAG